jgi:hypothetical protein
VNSIRRWILAGFVLLVSCEPAHTPFIRDGLERGQDRTEQWITEATRPDVAAATAISLGYLERLRLGLGSPFRLADQALHDPRLDEENRRDVAWAILSRTLDREAYIVEPAVLDGIAPDAHMAKLHLRFIEDAIRSAPHPRAGELAVRMAYTRAARNGMVSEAIPAVTARVAALFRDRELAMADVSRLLVAAADSAFDPLSRISDWRVERRFAVEAPLVSRATPETERAATAQAERMIPLISQLAANDAQETRAVARSSLLQPFSALRLANLTRSANLPPQAPVAVSVAAERAFVLDDPSSGADARGGRERFVENAVSEEAFAAEYALPGRAPHGGAMARTALSVAVALRAYAQEPVWFPGFPAPDAEQLAAAHGLVEVRFAADIPGYATACWPCTIPADVVSFCRPSPGPAPSRMKSLTISMARSLSCATASEAITRAMAPSGRRAIRSRSVSSIWPGHRTIPMPSAKRASTTRGLRRSSRVTSNGLWLLRSPSAVCRTAI